MLPEEGILTIIGCIIVGIFFGLTNRYLIGLILSVILALLVESYAVNNHFWYKFGDNLFKHLMIAICVFSAIFFVMRLFPMLLKKKRIVTPKYGLAPTGPHKTAIIPHALGLLNFFPFAGSIALAIYWVFNRTAEPARVEQIKDSFHFQALYMVLLVVTFALSTIMPYPHTFSLITTQILRAAWFIVTVSAVAFSAYNGSFYYPVKLRLFSR